MASKTLYYANGMNKFSADKVGKFIFGSFFREIEVDEQKRMFNFIINEYIEEIGEDGQVEKKYFKDSFGKEYRDYFKTFWGDVPGFNLKVVEVNIKEKNLDE